jgi:uncharacterized membrane protein YdjX (TVP38/TMEM64 family)
MSFFVFLSSHPPFPGFSAFLTLCGYILGFWKGILAGYLGAVLGGTSCFFIWRWMGMKYSEYRSKTTNNSSGIEGTLRHWMDSISFYFILVEKAVTEGGFPVSLYLVQRKTDRIENTSFSFFCV